MEAPLQGRRCFLPHGFLVQRSSDRDASPQPQPCHELDLQRARCMYYRSRCLAILHPSQHLGTARCLFTSIGSGQYYSCGYQYSQELTGPGLDDFETKTNSRTVNFTRPGQPGQNGVMITMDTFSPDKSVGLFRFYCGNRFTDFLPLLCFTLQ